MGGILSARLRASLNFFSSELDMKKAAVKKAASDLDDAIRHAIRMRRARNLNETRAAWDDFLQAANRIYNHLGVGCKGDPFDTDWIERKRDERKKDPLLSYLHRARGTVEHDIIDMLEPAPGLMQLHGQVILDGKLAMDPIIEIHDRGPTLHLDPNQIVGGTLIRPNGVRMADAVDTRFGDRVKAPDSHLGKPIANATPESVASLAIKYFIDLVREAETRVY